MRKLMPVGYGIAKIGSQITVIGIAIFLCGLLAA